MVNRLVRIQNEPRDFIPIVLMVQYIMNIVILDIVDIVIILPLLMCPRADPMQILLVIVISLLDIVLISAQIIQE